jgi:hypothetical protein
MALDKSACRGKQDDIGFAKNVDEQCKCPLTQEKIESHYLPRWEKRNPEENDITNWKCPDCNHSFGKHATGNFHIP